MSLFTFAKPILNYWARIGQRALPAQCLLCAAEATSANLCTACREDLPYLPGARCPICAVPSTGSSICGACLSHPPTFDRALAPCAYAFPLDRLIQRLKYSGMLAAAPLLADLMLKSVEDTPRPDLVIPMPLSKERLRERGFNQSLEIARPIAAALGVAIAPEACLRVAHGKPQSDLPWAERAANVRGAFVCMQDLTGRSVAVVDDVLTTGATMNELARVLRLRGAAEITAWVAARTVAHDTSFIAYGVRP